MIGRWPRHGSPHAIPLRVSLVLTLLVLAHFTVMHILDPSAVPAVTRAQSTWAVMADHRVDIPAHSITEQAVCHAWDGCSLLTIRPDSAAIPLPFALLASVLLVLGFILARSTPRLACLPLPRGPARQALLQRFTL